MDDEFCANAVVCGPLTGAVAVGTMGSCSHSAPAALPAAPLTHYVIVRADLPLGFLAAQVVHAAGESSPGNLPPETNAVVLEVADEGVLHLISMQLDQAGVDHRLIREPDPPWLNRATAIGIPPTADRAALRPILGGLRLLGSRAARPIYCECAPGVTCYTCNGGLRRSSPR